MMFLLVFDNFCMNLSNYIVESSIYITFNIIIVNNDITIQSQFASSKFWWHLMNYEHKIISGNMPLSNITQYYILQQNILLSFHGDIILYYVDFVYYKHTKKTFMLT